MLPAFTYSRPRTLDEALEALAGGSARVHAGGSDLLGCLHDGVFTTERVVSLDALDDLRGIREMPDGLPLNFRLYIACPVHGVPIPSLHKGLEPLSSVVKALDGLMELLGGKVRQQLLEVAVGLGGMVNMVRMLRHLVGLCAFDEQIGAPVAEVWRPMQGVSLGRGNQV